MALRLLLDEHLSPRIVAQIAARDPAIAITNLQTWQQGRYLHALDWQILEAARQQAPTLVTYDQRTIPSLLRDWGEQGKAHAGVILVDERTIAPEDIGAIVRALLGLWQAWGQEDWSDRVHYLQRPPRDSG